MHLPWTQVANEVIDQAAPQLASALDWHEDLLVAEDLALAGLLRFIRWAVGRVPTDRPPSASAVVPGPGAARLIALQMRYRGDPEQLVDALAAITPSPIITRESGGIRINGLDRYDPAWRKNFKDEAKAWDEHQSPPPPPSGRNPGGIRAESPRSPAVQTSDADVRDVEKIPPRAGARAEHGEADRSRPPSPPADDLAQLLDAEHQRARGRPLDWGRPRYRVDVERDLGDRAAQHGDAEVVRRLRNAMTFPVGKFPYMAHAGDLVKHWAYYAEPLPPPATGPPRRGAGQVLETRPAMTDEELQRDAEETARWNERWSRAAEQRRAEQQEADVAPELQSGGT